MIIKYTTNHFTTLINLLRLNTPTYFAAEEESDYIDYLQHHADNYFVVEVNGEIVGTGGINYNHAEGKAFLSWDLLHPNMQGKGYGSILTKYRIDAIRNTHPTYGVVVRTSQLAYTFYQKMGFTLKEVVKDYWAKGFDLYYMVLPTNT